MDLCRLTRGPDIVPEGLVSAHPHCDSPVDCFVAPRAQRTRSSWGGCGGLCDCAHLRRTQTGVRYIRIESTADSTTLFAGFRTRTRARAIYSDSVGWMTTSFASGTCPPTGAALVMTLCTGVSKRHVIVCATPELRGNPTVRIWAPLCCKVTLQCSWR